MMSLEKLESSKIEHLNNAKPLSTRTYPSMNKVVLSLFCGYVIFWYLQMSYRIPVLGSIRFEFFYAALLSGLAII